MQNRVAEIMSTLTPRQKQAMHYRYIDNLSISEISDVTNYIKKCGKRVNISEDCSC